MPSVSLTVAGIEVVAVSVAGIETCIEIPGWQLCFDLGRCPHTAVRRKRVCVTHAHVDHLGGLVHHVSQRDLLGMPPATYHVPHHAVDGVEALLAGWRGLDRSELPANVVGVRPGDQIEVGSHRRIRAFKSVHRVPTLGYALVRDHVGLLPELVGRPSAEIRARLQRGEPINVPGEQVEVVFCGDTRIDVVDREPMVRRARLLVLECTFLGPGRHEQARRTGHVHLDEIAERADLFENEAILLTHFSLRYGPQEILAAVGRLPERLRGRVVPLLGSHPAHT
ncbi:MAG: MBL fold metallo-hydrolase [Myxococcota bacterium]